MFNKSSLVRLGAWAVVLSVLSGCAPMDLEPEGIRVHEGYSASGAAWSYRSEAGAEPIIPGASQAFFEDDLGIVRDIWTGLPGQGASVTMEEDGVSPVLLITLTRDALATDNPFRGGVYEWWYDEIYHRLKHTLYLAEGGTEDRYRYSVHLAARAVDPSLFRNASRRAQLRIRHLARWLMEDGLDPRLLTAQVMESEASAQGWELAIALRPYTYGDEMDANHFLPPWLY